MDLGSAFVVVRDGEWLRCEVVWTGGMPLCATPESVSMASSLVAGETCIPARPNGPRGSRTGTRGSTLISQTAMRA